MHFLKTGYSKVVRSGRLQLGNGAFSLPADRRNYKGGSPLPFFPFLCVEMCFFCLGTKVPLSGHRIKTQTFAAFVDAETRVPGWEENFAEPTFVVVGPSSIDLNSSTGKIE